MTYHKKFEYSIWKVIPDCELGVTALELRDKQKKGVTYGFLDLESKKYMPISWDHSSIWWTGLLDFHQYIMLFHGYEESGLPTHKGIFAWDVIKDSILWKDMGEKVKQTNSRGIQVERGNIRQWKTGKEIDVTDFRTFSDKRDLKRHYPSHFLEGSEVFETWRHRLSAILPSDPVGQIALSRYRHIQIIQTYTGILGQKLTGHWIKSDSKGENLEVLGSSLLKGLLLDAFFIEEPYLFFMPKPDELRWLKLDPTSP